MPDDKKIKFFLSQIEIDKKNLIPYIIRKRFLLSFPSSDTQFHWRRRGSAPG